MQAVPPGFAGVAALLGRLASLTKVQTAALCLVFAAVPVSWQRHQTQLARKDAAAAQLTVEAARTHQEELTSEVARLRGQSSRLDGALSQATEGRVRGDEAARKEAALKARLFGLLTAADYHWPNDLDFVRIPKSAVKELNPLRAVNVSGDIQDWGAELLGLTPEEKQRTEAALRAYSQAFSQLAVSRAYETNYLAPSVATRWAGHPYKSVWVPPLGADAQPLIANLRAQVSEVLGEERTQLLLGDAAGGRMGYSTWGRTFLGLSSGELYTVCVNLDDPTKISYGQFLNGNGGSGVSRHANEVRIYSQPDAIASQFFNPWLAQLGLTNTASRANP